jgi:hypothetical protein
MVPVTSAQEVLDRLRDDLVAWMENEGFKVPSDAKQDCLKAVRAYVRVRHRSIPQRPRTVRWSRELENGRPEDKALKAIQAEFEAGQDVSPRLTRQFFRAGFDDRILNELGLQHFHLGPPGAGKKVGGNAMAGGTSELLFALVTEDQAYFLDVLGHDAFGHRHDDYMLGLIRENWPELLEPYRAGGASRSEYSFKDRQAVRSKGGNMMVEIGDAVYFPPGGGVVASRTNIRVVYETDGLVDAIRRSVERISKEAERVAGELEKIQGTRPASLDLRVLEFGHGLPVLLEQNTNTRIRLEAGELRMEVPTK